MSRCPSPTTDAAEARVAARSRRWEGTPVPDPKAWIASILLSCLAAIALGLVVDRFEGVRAIFLEDGPVEMLQALLLVAIAVAFVVAFARSADSRALFCLIAAYACIFAVTREIPRCGSAFVGGDVCLPSAGKRSIVIVASALALLALVLRPVDWRSALRLSNLRWTWPGGLVVGLLLAAEGLESLIYYSEIEEFLELAAYLHLGALAFTILRRSTQD